MLSVTRVTCVSAATIALIVGAATWRPSAERQPSRSAGAVQLIDPGAPPPPADPSDRGATYYWLESRATRVTTTFADAVAVAERDAGGDINTRLLDLVGNEIAALHVDRQAASTDVIDFRRPGEPSVRAAGRSTLSQTLDWGNRQAYSLWKDLREGATKSRLEWQDDVIRPAGARARKLDLDVKEVRTEWPDDVAATTTREARVRPHPVTGVRKHANFFVTRLRKGGQPIGSLRWEEEEQLLAWSFPSMTEGYLNAERLAELGGWTFTPDTAWGNVQSFAFYHFASLIASKGFVARNTPGWGSRIVSFFSPTLSANTAGCDGLHWLDGSVFRFCCDIHDRCYYKSACTWRSWWTFWSSWRCTTCNVWAVGCFSSGGKMPFYDSPF